MDFGNFSRSQSGEASSFSIASLMACIVVLDFHYFGLAPRSGSYLRPDAFSSL